MKRTIAFLLTLVMIFGLLSGCTDEVPEVPTEPDPSDSQSWETMPQLTYGVMEYEKLEVLPWYSGRAEVSGRSNQWAETKEGYYVGFNSQLWYADKTDLQNWIPVCSKPNCSHSDVSTSCNAYIGGSANFAIIKGRIYFCAHMVDHKELTRSESWDLALFSRALDGSDMRFETHIEGDTSATGYMQESYFVGPYWMYHRVLLNADGSYTGTVYRYDMRDGSITTWYEQTYEDGQMRWIAPARYAELYGDYAVENTYLGMDYFQITEGEPVATHVVDHPKEGTFLSGSNSGDYLSGNVLRQFRTNDGYYDIDLESGEEVFLAEPRLENSVSFIVLPNCIIETTMGRSAQPKGARQAMEFFDGETWRQVKLPPELEEQYSIYKPLMIATVASDRIFLMIGSPFRYTLYQIRLDQEELVMEYVADMR